MLEDDDPRRKLRLLPRVSYLADAPLWQVTTGVFGGVSGIEPVLANGRLVELDAPVVGISLDDVEAYLAWRRQRDGINWRLPTSAEWTLAVQAGDGRAVPWGGVVDLSQCYSQVSSGVVGVGQLAAVGGFPADRSVHGVMDLAGSVSEWVASEWEAAAGRWLIRGGSWKDRRSERFTSTDWRTMDHRQVSNGVGFRLAIGVSEGRAEHWPLTPR